MALRLGNRSGGVGESVPRGGLGKRKWPRGSVRLRGSATPRKDLYPVGVCGWEDCGECYDEEGPSPPPHLRPSLRHPCHWGLEMPGEAVGGREIDVEEVPLAPNCKVTF